MCRYTFLWGQQGSQAVREQADIMNAKVGGSSVRPGLESSLSKIDYCMAFLVYRTAGERICSLHTNLTAGCMYVQSAAK